jgi:hypothetical protein
VIVLAGDVGGTNARLATVELNGGGARILHQRVYRSRDYTALAPLVRGFCRELPSVPRRACFGLAGPVVDLECTATNLPWTVAVGTLEEEIGIPATTLTNDLVAVGHGLELLGAADLATLQAGVPVPRGPIGVIGVGSGLGQGLVIWAGDRRLVLPSEGGHADFAPDASPRLSRDMVTPPRAPALPSEEGDARGLTTVEDELRPGRERRLVTRQEHDQAAYLFRLAHAAHGNTAPVRRRTGDSQRRLDDPLDTELTRMPYCASSSAATFVRPRTPNFAATMAQRQDPAAKHCVAARCVSDVSCRYGWSARGSA